MKYITLIIGLLVVGCGKQGQTDADEITPATNTNKVDGTTGKPVKELTAEEKVVGEYEAKIFNFKEGRFVFLENGIVEAYDYGEKQEEEVKWELTKEGEIQLTMGGSNKAFLSINADGSMTLIARIDAGGKREEVQKKEQFIFKRIRIRIKELTPEKKKVVGDYEIKKGAETIRLVLLETGIGEGYENGKKETDDAKWELVEGEIHLTQGRDDILVLSVNKDGSLTVLAEIIRNKREELPKEDQMTLKKIK